MKIIKMETGKIIYLSLLGALLILTGCASTKPDIDASHVGNATLKAGLRQGVAEPTIDPNGQDMSAAVKAGLIEAFDKQAAKDGIQVSPTGTSIKITIQEYSTRSNIARFMLGALAGRDHIKARVDVAGTSYEIEDSAHSAVNGIDVVAVDVGVEAANGVAELAGLPIVTEQATFSPHPSN